MTKGFMLSSRVAFRKGYKYQLAEPFSVQTIIFPRDTIEVPLLSLNNDGVLHIHKGYAWDGPSGPTIDTRNFMRGALVHDALYQLMRSGRLDLEWRVAVDRLLQMMCRNDGMCRPRAWYVYWAVHFFAKKHALVSSAKKVYYAP